MTVREFAVVAAAFLGTILLGAVAFVLMFAFVRPAPTTFRPARSISPISRSSDPKLVTTPPRSPASNP